MKLYIIVSHHSEHPLPGGPGSLKQATCIHAQLITTVFLFNNLPQNCTPNVALPARPCCYSPLPQMTVGISSLELLLLPSLPVLKDSFRLWVSLTIWGVSAVLFACWFYGLCSWRSDAFSNLETWIPCWSLCCQCIGRYVCEMLWYVHCWEGVWGNACGKPCVLELYDCGVLAEQSLWSGHFL